MVSSEIEHPDVDVCRELAVRFMRGARDGSDRSAWMHAQDVADAVAGHGQDYPDGWVFWVCVGWLHDVLEDCEGITNESLTLELVASGVEPFRARDIVRMVRLLSKEKGESGSYFQRIRDCGHWQLSLIKVVDRIVNLREGAPVFSDSRWADYVLETREYVVPLVATIDARLREELLLELEMAMASRPAKKSEPGQSSSP